VGGSIRIRRRPVDCAEAFRRFDDPFRSRLGAIHDFLRLWLGLGFDIHRHINVTRGAGNEQDGDEANDGEWNKFHKFNELGYVNDEAHSPLGSVADSFEAGGVRFGLSTSVSSGLAGL
jgi:hypothetical protein